MRKILQSFFEVAGVLFCHQNILKPQYLRKNMETFTAIIEKEDDMYIASCPEVGTISQGESIKESVDNLREATGLYLEEFSIKPKRRSLLTTFEVANAPA